MMENKESEDCLRLDPSRWNGCNRPEPDPESVLSSRADRDFGNVDPHRLESCLSESEQDETHT